MSQTVNVSYDSKHANPMNTDGFEFVEYASRDPRPLEELFTKLGLTKIAKHKSKEVFLWRQNDINFILNTEKDSQAEGHFNVHGPSANAMAFRVKDAAHAIGRAKELGATVVESPRGEGELHIPAIEGIGGSLLYLVDKYGEHGSIYEADFAPLPGVDQNPKGVGLEFIDHLTHNVQRGQMDVWAGFYEKLFNFREIRYFDIEGKLTGLVSKAMTSPCGKIRIPLNESSDDKSQIEEFLKEYKGEGIQHIALSTDAIYETFDGLKSNGIKFMKPPPATYYDNLNTRVPHHEENLDELKPRGILVDGAPDSKPGAGDGGILLQIFTATVIGPIFFEVIQRKGDEGFGEGNFKALFESIEEDQVKRGVLKA